MIIFWCLGEIKRPPSSIIGNFTRCLVFMTTSVNKSAPSCTIICAVPDASNSYVISKSLVRWCNNYRNGQLYMYIYVRTTSCIGKQPCCLKKKEFQLISNGTSQALKGFVKKKRQPFRGNEFFFPALQKETSDLFTTSLGDVLWATFCWAVAGRSSPAPETPRRTKIHSRRAGSPKP